MDVTKQEDPIPELVESRWLRGLARSLVADPDQVEDAVQATTIAALAHQPDGGSANEPRRGWLATVLRNFVRQRRRADARRAARELRAAEREALPSTGQLVERLHAHRRLVEAVEALAEPYRSTILLRFFEERKPKEIARLQSVPIATVKSRLARGLAQLRGRLDRASGGDGRSWLAALLPLSVRPEGVLVPILGVTVVNVKIVASIVVVAAVGITSMWWLTGGSSAPPMVDGKSRESAPAPAGAPRPLPADGAAPARSDVAPELRPAAPKPAPSAPPSSPTAGAESPIRGRVIDCSGAPVANVEVAMVDADKGRAATIPARSVRSGPDGSFTFDRAQAAGIDPRLVVRDEMLATVYSSRPGSSDAAGDSIVVVARAASIGGMVLDENDRPLAGADVGIRLPADFRSRFHEVLDRSIMENFSTTSDGGGAFRLERVPLVRGATLGARLEGFETTYLPQPEQSVADLRLVMRKPGQAGDTLSGVVVDPAGALVADARVLVRGEGTRTDSQGRFTLATHDDEMVARLSGRFGEPAPSVRRFMKESGIGRDGPLGARIVAMKEGFTSGAVEVPVGDDGPQYPAFVVVQLGPPPLALRGRVLDQDGAPVAGAEVWIDDPRMVGVDEERGRPLFVENELAHAKEAWNVVHTGEDGEFVIDGLEKRLYRVVAMDPTTLLRVSRPNVEPGAGPALLQFPKSAVHDEVKGKVVTRAGDPVANARVHTQCDAFHVAGGTWHAAGDVVTTGKDGGFVIHDVPKEGVYLRVDGDDILPVEFGREKPKLTDETGGKVDDVRIVVSLRLHLKVELADPAIADEFEVRDEEGNPLTVDVFFGNGRRTVDRPRFESDGGGVVAVSDEAQTIVLFKAGAEVKRMSLALKRGEVNVVRP